MLRDFCTIVGTAVTSDTDTPLRLHWFRNVFTEAVGDLGSCSSDDMNSPYETEAPECSILTMEPTVSPVPTTAPTDIHDLTKNRLRCVDPDSVDPDMDYFPEKAYSDDSGQWEITYHGHYKVLTNKDSDVKYLLHQCGTEPPEDAQDDHHLVLSVPLQDGIVVTQTTQIPHLELLGLRSEIKAFVGNPKFISSPCLDSLIDDEDVDVIYDPDDPWNTDRSVELLGEWLDDHPGAVVLESPWGDKNGRNALVVSESKEGSNEAIFEWHEYYGALFNLEGMAAETVEETRSRYECYTNNAAVLAADLPDDKKPTVLWAYWSNYHNAWDVADCPGNYYCEYAERCSADILEHPDGVGSVKDEDYGTVYMTDEEFLEHGKDADHWIVPSPDWNTLYAEKSNILDGFKSVQNERVFDNQGKGPNAWFEQRLAEYGTFY